jgi:uncharacterized repeat protein (TIGR04138 family)
MSDLQFAEEILDQLQERHPRFHAKAYYFVLTALHSVIEGLGQPRHIMGRELAVGVRDLALERYGPMARSVLRHWGIHATEDVGRVVFALVEQEILVKSPPSGEAVASATVATAARVRLRGQGWRGMSHLHRPAGARSRTSVHRRVERHPGQPPVLGALPLQDATPEHVGCVGEDVLLCAQHDGWPGGGSPLGSWS